MGNAQRTIVFFDGVCALCDSSVQFLLDRDRRGVFSFAALQGETARELLPDLDERARLQGVVLYYGGVVYLGFRAVVRIGMLLYPVLRWVLPVFLYFPLRSVGEFFYGIVANHRYGWFGKFDACRMPDPLTKHRFLD